MKKESKKELSRSDLKKIVLKYHSLTTLNEAQLLYNLSKQANGNIVEIGSFKGGSTIILAKALKEPYKVIAIDPFFKYPRTFYAGKEIFPENVLPIFLNNIKNEKLEKKIIPIFKFSKDAVKHWNKKISLLWIDGDHSYNGVKLDFLLWEPYLEKGGIIAFHDTRDTDNYFENLKVKAEKKIGPYKLVQESILNSKRFSEIKYVDTITYVEKIKDSDFIEKIKNKIIEKFLRNSDKSIIIFLDKRINQIIIKIKKKSIILLYLKKLLNRLKK